MAKKVVLDPEGFEKVVAFVTDQKVKFNHLKRATDVAAILGSAVQMDITYTTPESTPPEEVK
jgi:hypothetical protein